MLDKSNIAEMCRLVNLIDLDVWNQMNKPPKTVKPNEVFVKWYIQENSKGTHSLTKVIQRTIMQQCRRRLSNHKNQFISPKKSHAALVSVGFDRPEIEQDRFCRRLISVSTSFFTNVVICAYVIMRIVLALCKQWTRSTQTTFCHSLSRPNQCLLKNNN